MSEKVTREVKINGNTILEKGDRIKVIKEENGEENYDFEEIVQSGNVIDSRYGYNVNENGYVEPTYNIEAHKVVYDSTIFYLCKDNGSFEDIEKNPDESFDEWLKDFDNVDELYDENII